MKKSFILFAALAALFSCTKETPVSPEAPSQETYSVTLTAVAPTAGDDTKTTLVEGGKFVHWSKGDAIKVLFFPNVMANAELNGASGVFSSNFSSESSNNSYFRNEGWNWSGVDMSIGGNHGYFVDGIAVYPHTATAESKKNYGFIGSDLVQSEVSFDLPSSQNAIVDNIESELNFSYARVSKSDFINTIYKNGTTELTFHNACAMIQLTMPNSFGDKKVTSISVLSNDAVALTGKGAVNLGNTNSASTQNVVPDPFTMTISGDSGVELINPTGFEAGKTYNAVVWPGNHPSGLTIKFCAEDGSVAEKTTKSVELKASVVKPYAFASELEFEENDTLLEGTILASIIFAEQYSRDTDLDNQKLNLDGVAYCKFSQGNSGNPVKYIANLQAMRMYQNGAKLEVAAPGKTIVAIDFTFSSSHWYIGTDQGVLSAEGECRRWVGEEESVKFISTGTDKSHRAYVSSIKVYYR